MQPISRPRRWLALLAATAAAAAAVLSLSPPTPAHAAGSGTVLWSPNLATFPNGTGGYPRATTLEFDGSSADTVLATFAKAGVGTPGSLPVYRSTNGGGSWSQVSEIRSNTAGWDIEAPTLYEVPRATGGLNAGDVLAAGTAWKKGDYTTQKVEVFKSTNGGTSWQYLSNCTQTSGLPNSWGHGIWEPSFVVGADGTLACYISDERPANSATNNQKIGHYTSTNGGASWSSSIQDDVVFPADATARPGMQTFAKLPDGRFVMSYELCRDGTNADHACEVYVKFSNDGSSWGQPGDRGTLVQTSDQRELLHTPYISWSPAGGPNGTLLLSGQRVVAGPTGNKTVLGESGTVMFVNKQLGVGPWSEVSTPVTVNPTGGYAAGVPSCPGYSTPAIPISGGTKYLYFAATWLGRADQCEVRVGTSAVVGAVGAVTGPGGKCLDVDTNTNTNGNRVQLYTCGVASGQDWSLGADQSVQALGKCLDVDAQGTANATKVQIWDCNGSGAQRWVPQANGSLLNPQSGRCLDDPQGITADGTKLQIYDCNGLATQRWVLPA